MTPIALRPDGVHIWRVRLDTSEEMRRELEAVLSVTEIAGIAGLLRNSDRTRSTIAHGALRLILAPYVSIPPRELVIVPAASGRPRVCNPDAPMHDFSMAHSHDVALIAISAGPSVGVDLEYMDQQSDWEAIARRFLPDDEVQDLQALPAAEQLRAFYQCWTRLEARVKASGEGLCPQGKELAWIEMGGWTTIDLQPHPAYAAALCVQAEGPRVQLMEWS